jgi:aminoglycoside 3-N-acetyltransferase
VPHTRTDGGEAVEPGLAVEDLLEGWRRAGITPGMHVIVHCSLSSLGHVRRGGPAVVESLQRALGPTGTLVAPTFTPYLRDPAPDCRGVPDASVIARRDAVPVFSADLPSTTGAVAEAVRTRPGAVRSRHPQASCAAVGSRAAHIVSEQPLGFAFGRRSPFGRLVDLDGRILLVGVGHERNSSLHHAETLTSRPRLMLRRFPVLLDGERVWCEALDVGHDDGTLFPVVGREFEERTGITGVSVGAARVVLLAARPLVDFAVPRLDQLLGDDGGTAVGPR